MKNILVVVLMLSFIALHGQWNGTASSGMYVTGNTVTGTYSTAMGQGTIASGSNSTSMGYSTQASGFSSIAMGYFTTASGDDATAMGSETTASGWYATAMGLETTASGLISTSMGLRTTASGDVATAIGSETTASGHLSTAMGYGSSASGYGTTAIGTYNTIDATAIPLTFTTTNRAFVIGNGTDDITRSDAMTILFDGTTTISGSVTAPSFVGDFVGDGSQLTSVGRLGTVTEGSNSGWRLMGRDPLNYGEIGIGAIDFSYSDNVSSTNGATGSNSIAMGYLTRASGNTSTAMGKQTTASGDYSTTMGIFTIASGNYSTAMGGQTTAIGEFSTAMGRETTGSGNRTTAMGSGTTASGYGTTAIGTYNTIDATATPTTFSTTNRALVIGNGIALGSESDAMTVLFDGTTTIAGDLTVDSDARLKSNILSLGNTLPMLKMLDGKTYNLIKGESQEKIGLLAQDVQKVFPQLVRSSKGDQAILSLNYQGLIPVLINAVNEQQDLIEKQQAQIDRLTTLVEGLVKEK